MKKKFLSLMLAVAMLAGILPTISLAATIDGEITFDASDGFDLLLLLLGDQVHLRRPYDDVGFRDRSGG